ncbi:endonuclease/exonuclease/phosphatase family protein [Vagococcus sp.]|uniref:endonuclease/exonuclease/phosphatase family protein n=1 Tax=Vagococcus sp. TaxID=1933889 RepID=UPI003F9D0DFA
MKKIKKVILISLLVIFIAVGSLVGFLSLTEYRPESVEVLEQTKGTKVLSKKNGVGILTYNIGYSGLSEKEDFFMDGGKKVQPDNINLVEENLKGITKTMKESGADIFLFQEVDRNSKRSFYINQEEYLARKLNSDTVFANNFKVDFVPFPLPPIGKVDSGLVTMTNLKMTEAKRISLPNPFTWPIRMANLKRALLETRFPIEGSEKELVVFNLHLEAYDSGEGKIAQSKKLTKVLNKEYQKGNYVVAGGDFNQVFEGSADFPKVNKKGWRPGSMQNKDLPNHFSFKFDEVHPTVRVLNGPYTGSYQTSEVHTIDGFIVSDNLKVASTQVLNHDFRYTDHQAVQLNFEFN